MLEIALLSVGMLTMMGFFAWALKWSEKFDPPPEKALASAPQPMPKRKTKAGRR